MFQRPFGQEHETPDADLNLTPVMNLFVAMIPFLLMSAAFFQISIINASVPTISNQPLEAGQSAKVMNVILQMGSDGFSIMGTGENVTIQELDSVRTAITKTAAGGFDLDTLGTALTSIKWRFPRGKTLILVPDRDIPYEEIVQTMDVSRWVRSARVEKAKNGRQLLYPNVVLSSVVREDG